MNRVRRGARRAATFQRKAPQLSGDLILIVCEGAETEPRYFEALKRLWKIHPVQLRVRGRECGSDPLSVVTHAARIQEEARKNGMRFDQVWNVMDKDAHTNLNIATDKARASNIKICLSVPCFEFWYLLHYIHTTRPFANADDVIQALKQHLPGNRYKKSAPPVDALMSRINTALENAALVRRDNATAQRQNPRTDVDLLVKELMTLRAEKPGERLR